MLKLFKTKPKTPQQIKNEIMLLKNKRELIEFSGMGKMLSKRKERRLYKKLIKIDVKILQYELTL